MVHTNYLWWWLGDGANGIILTTSLPFQTTSNPFRTHATDYESERRSKYLGPDPRWASSLPPAPENWSVAFRRWSFLAEWLDWFPWVPLVGTRLLTHLLEEDTQLVKTELCEIRWVAGMTASTLIIVDLSSKSVNDLHKYCQLTLSAVQFLY